MSFTRKSSFSNNIAVNNFDKDVKNMLKDIIGFLKNFANLLEMTKGQKQKLIASEELSIFLKGYQCPTGYLLFDIKEFYQQFSLELSRNVNTQVTAHNILDPQLLSICLLCMKNLLQDDADDTEPIEIYEYFLDLRKCILILSADLFALNTKTFRDLINCWIIDLVRIITDADDIPRNSPKHIKVLGVIKHILICLAKCNIYCDVLLKEISKKIENALSYYAATRKFSAHMTRESKALLYILWILHTCVSEFPSRGYHLNKGLLLGIRTKLKVLMSCLGNKCPSMIKHLIEKILKVVE